MIQYLLCIYFRHESTYSSFIEYINTHQDCFKVAETAWVLHDARSIYQLAHEIGTHITGYEQVILTDEYGRIICSAPMIGKSKLVEKHGFKSLYDPEFANYGFTPHDQSLFVVWDLLAF